MSGYALTPLAKADIFDIWSYIAKESEDAAARVEQAIYNACAFLADGPMCGHSRPDLTARALRFWTLTRYPNYTIVYRPETSPASGCRCAPWETKCASNAERAAVTLPAAKLPPGAQESDPLETRNSKLFLHPLNLYRVQHHIFVGLVLAIARELGDFVHHVLTFDDFAKDGVIAG